MIPQMLMVVAGILVAGTVSGATGLALPLIAGPIFLAVYPTTEAVALTALCSMTSQIFSIVLLRRDIAFEFRVPLITPGLLAVPIGTAILARVSPNLVHISLGALLVAAGCWCLFKPARATPRPSGAAAELFVGLVGGLTGGLVGASSVVPALWCGWRGLSKERQRAVIQPFILVMQLASLASLGASGSLDCSVLRDYGLLLAPLLVGVGAGVACFQAVSSATVTGAVMSLVTVTGIALLLV